MFGALALFVWTFFLPAQGVSLELVTADNASMIYGGAAEDPCQEAPVASVQMCTGGEEPEQCNPTSTSCRQDGNWIEDMTGSGDPNNNVEESHNVYCTFYCEDDLKYYGCGEMKIPDEYCN